MLLGDVELNGEHFARTLEELDSKFEGFVGKIAQYGAVAAGGLGAFVGLEKFTSALQGTVDLSESLRTLSLTTGESVHDLVIFKQALDLSGQGAGKTADFIAKLEKSIGGANSAGHATTEALQKLGTSVDALKGLGSAQQMDILQRGVAGLASDTDRASVAMELFGDKASAKNFIGIAASFAQARQQAEPLANVMQNNVESFHQLDSALKGLKLNSQEFFAGVLQGVAPEATNVANAMSEIDFVGIGVEVGEIAKSFTSVTTALIPLVKWVGDFADAMTHIDGKRMGKDLGDLSVKLLGKEVGSVVGGTIAVYAETLFPKQKEQHGLADAFKGLDRDDNDKTGKAPVSNLQRVAGGGGFLGSTDPILTENQRQTKLLEEISRKVTPKSETKPNKLPPHV